MKMLSMRLSQRLRQNTLTWALCVLPLAFGSYACGSTSDPSSAADGATEGAADASPARQGELSGLSISSRAPLEPAFAPTQLIYNVDTSVLCFMLCFEVDDRFLLSAQPRGDHRHDEVIGADCHGERLDGSSVNVP